MIQHANASDCVYITNIYRLREQTPMVHAAALRKDGLIVRERDDLISATRVGLMMLRTASSPEASAPHSAFSDYDPLAGTPSGHGPFGRTREEHDYDPLR